MFILAKIMEAVAFVLGFLLSACLILIVARVVLSWFIKDPYHPAARFLNSVTEPAFVHIQRKIPLQYSGIDFTPVIVLLVIFFLQVFLVQYLEDFARKLQAPGHAHSAETL